MKPRGRDNPDGTNADELVKRIVKVCREATEEFIDQPLDPTLLVTLGDAVRRGVVSELRHAGALRLPVIVPKPIDSDEDRAKNIMRFEFEYRHPDTDEVMTEDEVCELMGLDDFIEFNFTIEPHEEEGDDRVLPFDECYFCQAGTEDEHIESNVGVVTSRCVFECGAVVEHDDEGNGIILTRCPKEGGKPCPDDAR